MNDLILYAGVGEPEWFAYPVSPGQYACISPVCGRTEKTKRENIVKLPPETLVIQDSGAFSDSFTSRLTPQKALDRQLAHSDKYGYAVESVASYDLLIDEKWIGGKRYKSRWPEEEAELAVKTTIQAAKFLSKVNLPSRVLSAQGVSLEQYFRCTQEIVDLLNPETDIFGLGGWCISGMMSRQILPYFNAIMLKVIPYLGHRGVKRVHIWGVMDIRFLSPLLWLCDQAGVQLSTDSSGPVLRPTKFGAWGYRGWANPNYIVPDNRFLKGLHQALHVEWTRDWLKDIRQSSYYREPQDIPVNLSVW